MNKYNYTLNSLIAICVLSSCEPSKIAESSAANLKADFGEVIYIARSVEGTLSNLEIQFCAKNQYVATYSSDSGSINNIYYSGHYEMHEDFFILSSPIFGVVMFKADDDNVYMPEGCSVEEGINSGMRLSFVKK